MINRPLTRSFVLSLVVSSIVGIVAAGLAQPPPYLFEVTLHSSVAGQAQVYYDKGQGLSESDSVWQSIRVGDNQISLPLPFSTLRSLRFDPLNGEGEISFRDARITAPGGDVHTPLPPSDFTPSDQLRDLESSGEIRRLVTPPGSFDPQLSLSFAPPLDLAFNLSDRVIVSRLKGLTWSAITFAALLLLPLAWHHLRRGWPSFQRRAHRHPQLTLTCFAAAAAMAASYPVVFFGQSLLSPNSGMRLLYDGTPTVPMSNYSHSHVADPRGADIGAIHWAHQPYTVMQNRALHEGSLPLWNRYNSAGVTLLGQGQSMFGEPLHFLVTLAGGEAWTFDIKYVLCKALFALGLGLAVWLLTGDLAAAVIITCSGAFIGFFNFRVNHPAIFTVSYSPWVLVAWLKILRASTGRHLQCALVLWFIANWCLLTSGTMKEAYLLCAALNATGALMLLLAPVSLKTKLWRLAPIVVAGAALMLAAAPQWWTFLDALHSAKTFYDTPGVQQVPSAWLIGLFDDIFYMESLPDHPVYTPSANFLILLGCLLALAQFRRLWSNAFALPLLLGLITSLAFALTWIPPSWLLPIPFLRNIHHLNNHFSCIAIVHAAVLAGWAFSAARRPLANGRAALPLGLVAVLLAALFIAYFRANPTLWTADRGFTGWRESFPQHAVFYAYALTLVIALTILSFVAVRHLRGKPLTGFAFSLAALAVLALFIRHAQHLPLVPPTRYVYTPGPRANLFTPTPTTEFLRAATATEPARIVGSGNALFTGFIAVHGLESHNGPDALFSPHYREFLVSSGLVPPHDWRSVLVPPSLPAWQPFLDFLNVGYIGAMPNTIADSNHYRRVAALDLDIIRAETAWPRAFFVDRLARYDTLETFIAMIRQSPAGQPFAAVQTSDADAPRTPTPPISDATFAAATDYRLTTNTTAFTVNAPSAGFAVLHESWLADDFRVTLNGEPAPYFRANHAFKGIALPSAGTYRIEVTYWPKNLTLCLVLCGIGFATFLILLIKIRRLSEIPQLVTR